MWERNIFHQIAQWPGLVQFYPKRGLSGKITSLCNVLSSPKTPAVPPPHLISHILLLKGFTVSIPPHPIRTSVRHRMCSLYLRSVWHAHLTPTPPFDRHPLLPQGNHGLRHPNLLLCDSQILNNLMSRRRKRRSAAACCQKEGRRGWRWWSRSSWTRVWRPPRVPSPADPVSVSTPSPPPPPPLPSWLRRGRRRGGRGGRTLGSPPPSTSFPSPPTPQGDQINGGLRPTFR